MFLPHCICFSCKQFVWGHICFFEKIKTNYTKIIKWRRQNISQFISFFPSRSAMEMRQTLEERRCARRGDAEKPSYEEMHRTLDALWPFRNYMYIHFLSIYTHMIWLSVFVCFCFVHFGAWICGLCKPHVEITQSDPEPRVYKIL